MDKQKTIAKQITFSGIGLHTGNYTDVILKPAKENTGVVFIRRDEFDREVEIPASYLNVTGYTRGTTVSKGNFSVSTVEHVLSALCGLGIDNIRIEVSENEMPILDGSAESYVKYLLKAGIVEQSEPKRYITLKNPVIYKFSKNEEKTEIVAYPSDELKVECIIDYEHPFIGRQDLKLTVNPQTYIKEISSAKTFCFDYEIEALKRKGLAKGGKLENVIVIGLDKIHNQNKLKYKDEFVRHKILDLLGDIYLLGYPLKAIIVGYRTGHKHNINFVKKVAEEYGGEK